MCCFWTSTEVLGIINGVRLLKWILGWKIKIWKWAEYGTFKGFNLTEPYCFYNLRFDYHSFIATHVPAPLYFLTPFKQMFFFLLASKDLLQLRGSVTRCQGPLQKH